MGELHLWSSLGPASKGSCFLRVEEITLTGNNCTLHSSRHRCLSVVGESCQPLHTMTQEPGDPYTYIQMLPSISIITYVIWVLCIHIDMRVS